MENETKIGILLTIIVSSIIWFSIGASFVTSITTNQSHVIFQMGVCMTRPQADLVTCQTIVDSNFKGTNGDK